MFKFVLMSFAFIGTNTWADSVKIDSFALVKVDHLDSGSLVVTDINDTLVTCAEALWQKSTQKLLPDSLQKDLKALSPAGKNLLVNLVLTKCHSRELGGSANFFTKLKTAKVPHFALTASFPNKLDNIHMQEKISAELQNLGISFLSPQPHGALELEKLSIDRVSKARPTFVDGILFTAGAEHSKGQVLQAYLAEQKLNPNRIVFIDDSVEHIESILGMGRDMQIVIEAYHFVPQAEGLRQVAPEHVTAWETLIARAKGV